MKFGCCSNMIASKPNGTGSEWIPDIAASGFDYIELPLAQIMELDEEELSKVKKSLVEHQLVCESCNNFFPVSFRLTGEYVDRKAIREYYIKALKRASELGAKIIVFGSGPAKQVPEGFSMKEGYDQVVDLLKEIAPAAQEVGITIAIEPLRKEECNLINTFKEGCKLAKDVDHPNVRVLVDYYHLSCEKEPVEHLIQNGKEYLVHVHFAKHEGRVYPEHLAEDSNYISFIQALKEIGYEGRVSCEAFTKDFKVAGPIARTFFRDNFK